MHTGRTTHCADSVLSPTQHSGPCLALIHFCNDKTQTLPSFCSMLSRMLHRPNASGVMLSENTESLAWLHARDSVTTEWVMTPRPSVQKRRGPTPEQNYAGPKPLAIS